MPGKRLSRHGSIRNMHSGLAVTALLLGLSWVVLDASVADERYWAQWRGPAMTGVSRDGEAANHVG